VSIIRVGATKKFADGWETAFGKGGKRTTASKKKAAPAKATRKTTARKTSAKKKVTKKKARR